MSIIKPHWLPESLPKTNIRHPDYLAFRQAAFERLLRDGLPRPQGAYWQYTNLASWCQPPHALATTPQLPTAASGAEACEAWQYCDGQWSFSSVLPHGVTVSRLSEHPELWSQWAALPQEIDTAAAMNWSLIDDALVVTVAPGVQLQDALVVQFLSAVSSAPSTQCRLLIEVGEDSCLTWQEEWLGATSDHWCQVHCDWVLRKNAKVALRAVQRLSSGQSLSVHRVHQATHSQFTATAVALGAAQSRWVCEGFLNGSNASFSCQLLVQQAMTQQHDAVVHAHHQAPHTKSDVQCRSIADDQAQTASSFKAHVAANAEGAEASQNHQNILLSSAARMHSKPSLEIYTDDVTCAHGATVGALDEAALFFLRSRGLSEAAARSMLLMAFAEHILQQVPDDAWQQNCRERLALWAPQQQLGAVEAASSQEVPQ